VKIKQNRKKLEKKYDPTTEQKKKEKKKTKTTKTARITTMFHE
jgi:hypothetical protein